jgi:catechol 2,3-dioxygenase-like lactoylglutathione lyase family enzyme
LKVRYLRENETDERHGWRHLTTGGAKGKRTSGGRAVNMGGIDGLSVLIDYPAMPQMIGHVTLVVRNYDEAIEFFTNAMGFELLEDLRLDEQKRWVLVGPKGATCTSVLLAEAATPEQRAAIGNQTGGRVFLFLQTDDFWRDYNRMVAAGVRFREEPREESYGLVAVFEDLYGNGWDLLQRK